MGVAVRFEMPQPSGELRNVNAARDGVDCSET